METCRRWASPVLPFGWIWAGVSSAISNSPRRKWRAGRIAWRPTRRAPITQPPPRREFLKIAAGAAGATGLAPQGRRLVEPFARPPETSLGGEEAWFARTCRQCAAGCGILVRVLNGRARKIEGNPLHPLNRGKLCARGQAGLQVLYNPDRLRNAVRQTGGRGAA